MPRRAIVVPAVSSIILASPCRCTPLHLGPLLPPPRIHSIRDPAHAFQSSSMKILRPSSHPAPAPSRALPAAALATIVGSLFALMPVASNTNTNADPAMTNVVALAARRLALAEPVAKWKWVHHRPIQGAPRKQALLFGITAARRASRHR